MARGRHPKDPKLRLVENNRGHRPIPNVPRPESSRPPCPMFLRHEARRAWRYACEQLERMGTLGSSDQGVIVTYCQQWEIAVLATRRMQDIAWEMDRRAAEKATQLGQEPAPGRMSRGDWSDAFLTQTTNGNVIQSALMGVANAAWKESVRCASLLGFSPSDRARINLPAPTGKSLREVLLG